MEENKITRGTVNTGNISFENVEIRAVNIIFEDEKNLEEKMKEIQESINLNRVLIEQFKL